MLMAKYKNGVAGLGAHNVDVSSRSDLESGLLIQNSLLWEIYITRCSTNREDRLKKHHETLVHI